MASFSLSGLKRESCGGHPVMVLSLDGKQVFCFIGWMQHTRPEMLSLNSYGSKEILEIAKALAGFDMNRSYRISRFVPLMIEGDFRKQQAVVSQLVTVPVETRNDYLLKLQAQAALYAMRAAGSRHMLACRDLAIKAQDLARDAFRKSADVRGLFDTPPMDDSHAVECEVSRVDVPAFAYIDACKASYRERAYNAYGRYAMYCARACVAPYAFPEWFADCYMGHESDPAANWN